MKIVILTMKSSNPTGKSTVPPANLPSTGKPTSTTKFASEDSLGRGGANRTGPLGGSQLRLLLAQEENLLLAQEEDLLLAQEEDLLLAQEEDLLLAQEEDLLLRKTNPRKPIRIELRS